MLCPLNSRAEGLGQRVLLRCTGEEEGWEAGECPGRYLGRGQGQQPKRETETASSRPSLHGHQGDMALSQLRGEGQSWESGRGWASTDRDAPLVCQDQSWCSQPRKKREEEGMVMG